MKSGSLKSELTVIHNIPGRVRFHSDMIYYINDSSLAERLLQHPFLTSAEYSHHTGNILISFSSSYTVQDVASILEETLKHYTVDIWKKLKKREKDLGAGERDLHQESIKAVTTRVALAGITLAAYAVKRKISPAGMMSVSVRNFLRPPSLVAMLISIPVIKNGIEGLIINKRPNADTLSTAAIIASIIAGNELSALTITFLSELAELITAYSMDKTRKAIHNLLSVGEEYVWKVDDQGNAEKVSIKEIQPGENILIHTGEKISVDGRVLKGHACVDQSVITGESLPVTKEEGSDVFAGTVIQSGTLTVKALQVGDKTAVSRVIKLVEEATDRKASVQKYADNFSAQLIGLNFFLAGAVFMATRNPAKALNMLIIDYSCGVRLSTATALSMAIASAAKQGVLIKGSDYIEKISDADTVLLDKTGTVTKGKPTITNLIPVDHTISDQYLLEIAAGAEKTSSHPLAKAIVDKCNALGYSPASHSECEIIVSRGVKTVIDGKKILVGSDAFLTEEGVDISPLTDKAEGLASIGESVIYISCEGNLMGIMGIRDILKESMKKSINRLRQQGVDEIVLLTGDMKPQAELIASQISADSVVAQILPETKSQEVIKRRAMGSRVIMVGDGINDAPALAYSDVGIAMGATRTDVAMEAADITIAKDNPLLLPGIVNLSRYTMKIIKQNFTASIALNSAGLLLGTAGVLPVVWGAVLHNTTTLAVVLNSARVFFYDLEGNKNVKA